MKIEWRDGFGHLVHDDNDRDAVIQGLRDSYDDAVVTIRQAYPFFAAEGLAGTYYQHDDGTWERVPGGEFRGPEGAFCNVTGVLR